MILELAVLDVRGGEATAFEAAFDEAKAIISASPGFRRLELRRCIETADRYVLLVEWGRLEDHTEGFRGSDSYRRWRDALHHFYDPFPVVEHYEPLIEVSAPAPRPLP